jgi:hypothetical protein
MISALTTIKFSVPLKSLSNAGHLKSVVTNNTERHKRLRNQGLWDDEWLEEDVVQEDEEGEWEDFNRLKLTEDESGQVKLTVTLSSCRETSCPPYDYLERRPQEASQAKSWIST